MKIQGVAHKGLRRLVEDDDVSGVDPRAADKLRKMISFLVAAANVAEVEAFPLWKPHQLSGDRKGTWSLSVTRNWRLTFAINEDGSVADLDFEDYH